MHRRRIPVSSGTLATALGVFLALGVLMACSDGGSAAADAGAGTSPEREVGTPTAPTVSTVSTLPSTTIVRARPPAREPRADPAARVVGYYAGWQHGTLAPASLPTGLLTHVIYAFASVTADSRCVLLDPATEQPVIDALQRWKQRSGAATLLAVGGWEQSRHFSEAAATADGRARLADSCVALARGLGFDGIDLDWEYPSGGKWPGRVADPANHLALITELRSRLVAGELLTVAMPASPDALQTFATKQLSEAVDWINVMSYDIFGPWDAETGHNAPITSAGGPFGARDAIEHYEREGVPPAKLVLGVPFYGHAFAGVDVVDGPTAGMRRPFTGAPRFAPSGALPYRAVVPLIASAAWVRHVDDLGRVPWLVNVRDRQVISYDDPESIRAKVAFAKEAGLAGMMVWELSGDTSGFTLLRAMNDELGRTGG